MMRRILRAPGRRPERGDRPVDRVHLEARGPRLRRAWAEAVEAGVDLLEQEALRRAREGVDRPAFQGGVCVGMVREYSDTLMAMLLSGRRAVYRRNYRDEEAPEVLRIIFEGGV